MCDFMAYTGSIILWILFFLKNTDILHFFQNFTFFPKFYIFFKILCILYFWKKNFECDTTNKRRTHWLDGAHNDCSFYCIRFVFVWFLGGGVGSNSPEVGATSPLLGFLLPLDLLLLLSAVLLLCQDEHCSEFSVGIKCWSANIYTTVRLQFTINWINKL